MRDQRVLCAAPAARATSLAHAPASCPASCEVSEALSTDSAASVLLETTSRVPEVMVLRFQRDSVRLVCAQAAISLAASALALSVEASSSATWFASRLRD